MRIFHKYTGLIVVVVIVTISLISWNHYESQTVFFEFWSCERVMSMPLDTLDAREHLRYQEIKAECLDTNFMPRNDTVT